MYNYIISLSSLTYRASTKVLRAHFIARCQNNYINFLANNKGLRGASKKGKICEVSHFCCCLSHSATCAAAAAAWRESCKHKRTPSSWPGSLTGRSCTQMSLGPAAAGGTTFLGLPTGLGGGGGGLAAMAAATLSSRSFTLHASSGSRRVRSSLGRPSPSSRLRFVQPTSKRVL